MIKPQYHLMLLVKAGICHGVQMGEPSDGGRNHGVQPVGRLDQTFLYFLDIKEVCVKYQYCSIQKSKQLAIPVGSLFTVLCLIKIS